MTRPKIVQHSFGDPGTGGPIMSLQRVLDSELASKYTFHRMHQNAALGGVDLDLLREWSTNLRRLKPDLVHVRGLGNEGFHGVVAARLASCPRILLSIHGTTRDLQFVERPARRRVLTGIVEPCTLRLATHIVTVCNSGSKRDFLKNYSAKFAGVLPNGVELPDVARPMRNRVRRELGLRQEQMALVVVGRLSVEKGHLILAQALREPRINLRQAALILVGDGPDRSVIEAAYRSVDNLAFYPMGRRIDVAEILQACDAFVFPTLHENLSNALLEAMAAGLPVVASAVGGNVEVLDRGGGILVPASSPGALADALARLLADPSLRHTYGVQARGVIAERYTTAHMIDKLDRIYTSILRGGTVE